MGERAEAEVAERVGPWIAHAINVDGRPLRWKVYRAVDDGEAVCQLFDKNHEPFLAAETNAHLIAAAPDMLAALREAAMCIPPGTQLRNQINAAIAKAEGR